MPADDAVELFQKLECSPAAVGEIQREGRTRTGEGEHAGRRDVAEYLEHRKKRRISRMGDTRENPAHALVAGFEGKKTLVLQEAAPAVKTIPVFDGIEFLIGTGFSTSNISMAWATFLGVTNVGSGSRTDLFKGNVVGFSNVTGFDELRVAANASPIIGFGDSQAIALDNVNTSLVSVPEPSTLLLLSMGLAGLVVSRSRRLSSIWLHTHHH